MFARTQRRHLCALDSRRDRRDGQSGFSLAELMIGVMIFTISAVVLGTHVTSNFNTTQSQRDLVFAYTKAQAILSEIHSFVDRGEIEAAVDLDILDDGVTNDPVLTVSTASDGSSLTADHPLSGNSQRGGEWIWTRQVSVRPFAGLNNRNVRFVTVRINKRDVNGVERELASLSSVINSVASSFPTTQVFDVFLLAIESIPGWWVHMESIIPFVESAITDLENRNPGLAVRTHWITKAGYGRDRTYRPTTNSANDSHTEMDDVYYYPGKMPDGNASSYYYVPDLFNARVDVDGTEQNGWDTDLNPWPYALADFYNHCMRYPRAKELHDNRVAAVQAREAEILAAEVGGLAPPDELLDMSDEPTLQVLLEEMASNPELYQHALIVNLHGELLPVPPLRNYSDAAKSPTTFPNLRVVTHPEELRTARPGTTGDTTAHFRVYAYSTDPDSPPFERMTGANSIFLSVMDVDLTDGANRLRSGVQLQRLEGGYDDGAGSIEPYLDWDDAPSYFDSPGEMSYYAQFVAGGGVRPYTLILLFNTPVIARADSSGRGLYDTERSRLYDLEYVPSSPGASDFGVDLYDTGDRPKNTARWRLSLGEEIWDDERFVQTDLTYYDPRDTSEPDVTFTVRTRLTNLSGAWTSTGGWFEGVNGDALVNEPANLSETYTWWADSFDDVPVTERGQFLGDPRHNPYKDLLNGDPDFGDRYNWFFDQLTNDGEDSRNDYPGIVRTWNRWNGSVRQDVPRLLELYRGAIVESRSIYTTLTGYSYYYMGIGNEIGYDGANGYPSSIPTSRKPWGSGDSSTGYVNNITGSRCYVRESGSNYWWGMPWLGELYPDSAYESEWRTSGTWRGNLSSGTTSGRFYRQQDYSCYWNSDNRAYGTRMYSAKHLTSSRGCVSFFNIGTSSSHYNHHFSSGSGYLTGPGLDIADNYGFPMPSSVTVTRPFSVDTGGNVPTEYDYAPYSTERYSGTIARTFFNHPSSGQTGSGLVRLTNPAGTNAGYIVANGIAQTTTIGTSFIAKYCLLSMYQSFFETGDPTWTFRIKQPPRVEIQAPTEITEINDPTSIDIQFSTDWTRWDGQPYTNGTSTSFSELESELEYVILYSRDNGQTWLYIQDGSPATFGVYPDDPSLIVADAGSGDETYTWNTPSGSFPEGSYQIRVECYRQNQALHYSQHQAKIYVAR